MKTLIVDDDRVSAVTLRRLLEQLGHTVTLVENAKEAWKKLQTEAFPLVISAWLMPEMTGPDLMRRIRARPGAHNVYFILLSNRDRREDRQAAFSAGVDDFLTVPFDREELFSRVSIAERDLDLREKLVRTSADLARMTEELQHSNELAENYMEQIRGTCRDLEQANARLKAQSITDGLTGLKNHREFQDRLEDEMNRATRYHLPLSLIMLDVDHFKRFNDTYGHPAGDEVLKRLAKVLQIHARETDILARYGGEEFAIILANTDREHAMAAAERFRTAIADEPWPCRAITVSMGVSTLRLVPQSRADLATEADMALYACKSRGRNCIGHYADAREIA